MKGDDVFKSEDLLSNKEELSHIISEGEAQTEPKEKIAEAAPKVETEEKAQEVINVHSDNPNMKWYIVYVRTGQEQKAKEQLEQK